MNLEPSALTGKGNYFEDFNVGDVYEHARGKTMEALENVLITNLVLNTAQAHFNEHLAESLPQQHRITFGGVTASLVIGLAMQDTGENAMREVSLDKVRFRVPVLHGDTLYAFTEVLGKDDGAEAVGGVRDVGAVHFKHWGVNQRGETVFEGERRVLIKKRSFSTDGLEIEGEVLTDAPARPAIRRSSVPRAKARMIKAASPRKKVAPAKKAAPPKKTSGKGRAVAKSKGRK